jgi:hypothetical protein
MTNLEILDDAKKTIQEYELGLCSLSLVVETLKDSADMLESAARIAYETAATRQARYSTLLNMLNNESWACKTFYQLKRDIEENKMQIVYDEKTGNYSIKE